jgi:putative MFS transporter
MVPKKLFFFNYPSLFSVFFGRIYLKPGYSEHLVAWHLFKRSPTVTEKKGIFQVVNALVVVAALGYFVDIYDLVLFSIVRIESLTSLGVTGPELLTKGVLLLNVQMIGMLIGGIFWGVLGDKKGRLSVLFGSILLYSVANIANAFVHSVNSYAMWRFIAGIGLAGELGAGITLVAETLSKEKRGYATMWIATVGVSGAVFAGIIAEFFSWRTNFLIGGVLGLLLLALRVSVVESGLFEKVSSQKGSRGNFFSLFTTMSRFWRYLICILIGVPLWYVVGILITFSPEISQALGVVGSVSAGKAVLFCYLGLVFGDFASGWLSQIWKSRKRAVFVFLTLTLAVIMCNFLATGITASAYYALCAALGFSSGYWAVFVTVGAEQFGTNLRATVAITVPNFVRGSVVPLTLLFQRFKPMLGIVHSAAVLGIGCIIIAFVSLFFLKETYGKDMDFVEQF